MKLPRWLVAFMLAISVFALLGGAAWWWATWPQRTAQQFFEAFRDGRFDSASNIIVPKPRVEQNQLELLGLTGEHEYTANLDRWQNWFSQSHLVYERRSFADMCRARRKFHVAGHIMIGHLEFVVERNQVTLLPIKWDLQQSPLRWALLLP